MPQHDRSKFDNSATDEVDEAARMVSLRWRAGDLEDEQARLEVLRLLLGAPLLQQCVNQQATAPTPQAREDMMDWMVDLLEHKVLGDDATNPLDLDRLADGSTSACAWARRLLNGSGPFLRQRIVRAERQTLRRMAHLMDSGDMLPTVPDGRSQDELAARMAWAAPQEPMEESVLASDELPAPDVDEVASYDGTDHLLGELLTDGTRLAARAAAFRRSGNTYRGSRRLATQVALAARMMELEPPGRLPMSRWEDREEIRRWCQGHEDGLRLRQLLTMLRTGQDGHVTPVEAKVVSLFEDYTIPQLAALTTRPGYVLVHMAQSAVEPTSPPPRKVVRAMVEEVGALTGQAAGAGRLVRRWAAAEGELTASEYSNRGRQAEVKSPEQAVADEDLFEAEARSMAGSPSGPLGRTVAEVRSHLDSMYQRLMLAELDAQVAEWVAPPPQAVAEPVEEPAGTVADEARTQA